MTISAKSHAREKPVLTGYEGKKKKKFDVPTNIHVILFAVTIFFSLFSYFL